MGAHGLFPGSSFDPCTLTRIHIDFKAAVAQLIFFQQLCLLRTLAELARQNRTVVPQRVSGRISTEKVVK